MRRAFVIEPGPLPRLHALQWRGLRGERSLRPKPGAGLESERLRRRGVARRRQQCAAVSRTLVAS